MKKAWFQLTGFVLVAMFMSSSVYAAKLVQPPIQDLFKDRNQVTVLELKSADKEEQQGEFKKVKDLWGETDDEITLRVPARVLEEMKEGQRYIVGHSPFRKHPLLRDEIQPNPNGPEILHPYVVDNAVFTDSKALRYLIKAFQKEDKDASKILSKTLEVVAESGGTTRLLGVFQFQMSDDLYAEGLGDKHLKQIKMILEDDSLTPEEQEFILRATREFSDDNRQPWIAQHCRDIIAENPAPYDLRSFTPLLVKTCATILGTDGGKDDTKILTQLLLGNAPGVSKSALRALEDLAGDETPQLIANVLKENPKLHNETRGVLTTYMYEYALEEDGGKY